MPEAHSEYNVAVLTCPLAGRVGADGSYPIGGTCDAQQAIDPFGRENLTALAILAPLAPLLPLALALFAAPAAMIAGALRPRLATSVGASFAALAALATAFVWYGAAAW